MKVILNNLAPMDERAKNFYGAQAAVGNLGEECGLNPATSSFEKTDCKPSRVNSVKRRLLSPLLSQRSAHCRALYSPRSG